MNYLSVKEAAKQLGVTTARVYQYIREQRLPAEKAGTHTLIKTEDLMAFMGEPRPNGRYLKPRPPKQLRGWVERARTNGCPCEVCNDLRNVYNHTYGTDSATTPGSSVSTAPPSESDAGPSSTDLRPVEAGSR
jgi:excisionase family DNA binding protein